MKHLISNKGHSEPVPALQHATSFVADNIGKAHLLNDFFCRQTYTGNSNKQVSVITFVRARCPLNSIQFTPDDVSKILLRLPIFKASWPDLINNRIAKELAYKLLRFVIYLFVLFK